MIMHTYTWSEEGGYEFKGEVSGEDAEELMAQARGLCGGDTVAMFKPGVTPPSHEARMLRLFCTGKNVRFGIRKERIKKGLYPLALRD